MNNVTIAILTTTVIVIAGLAAIPRASRRMSRSLRVGDRIRLSGGYEPEPAWLGTQPYVDGRVVAFTQGTASKRAAVIRLDEPIRFENISAETALLYLRYEDARWGQSEVVHLELQVSKIDGEHKWVESHASYRVLRA